MSETLSAKFHEIYQAEARRQGDVRHKDAYADLPENIKEFDRVLARHVARLLDSEREKARTEALEFAAEHLPKHVENPDYPTKDKLIQGWSVCVCGQAKADGVRPYKEIWLEHIHAILREQAADRKP